jgi:hypothetical protein
MYIITKSAQFNIRFQMAEFKDLQGLITIHTDIVISTQWDEVLVSFIPLQFWKYRSSTSSKLLTYESTPEHHRHAAGEPIVAPQRHGHGCLYACLGRIGDILCPGLLKNLLGAGPLSAIVRMHGNQHVAFLNFPLVALGLIFRNT